MMLKAVVLLACAAIALSLKLTVKEYDDDWDLWKQTHSKQYTEEEEDNRRQIWEENLQKVTRHNLEHSLGLHSYRMGMNQFADLATRGRPTAQQHQWNRHAAPVDSEEENVTRTSERNDEFRKMMNGLKNFDATRERKGSKFLSYPLMTVPDAVDWRKSGYVTPVKDQGQCGSCWAFSTTGSLEGQHFRATGKLVSLSEQNLVDCSTFYGNDGCEGGLVDQAFQYIMDNGGIDTETSYPYEAEDDTCKYNPAYVGSTVESYVDVPSEDEDALKEACGANGPISVAIDASHVSFQFYESGVYDEPECSTTDLDHAVLVAGYDTTKYGQDYWIVKNSWGETWGNQGYIWMSRNKENQCGIATYASFPTLYA